MRLGKSLLVILACFMILQGSAVWGSTSRKPAPKPKPAGAKRLATRSSITRSTSQSVVGARASIMKPQTGAASGTVRSALSNTSLSGIRKPGEVGNYARSSVKSIASGVRPPSNVSGLRVHRVSTVSSTRSEVVSRASQRVSKGEKPVRQPQSISGEPLVPHVLQPYKSCFKTGQWSCRETTQPIEVMRYIHESSEKPGGWVVPHPREAPPLPSNKAYQTLALPQRPTQGLRGTIPAGSIIMRGPAAAWPRDPVGRPGGSIQIRVANPRLIKFDRTPMTLVDTRH